MLIINHNIYDINTFSSARSQWILIRREQQWIRSVPSRSSSNGKLRIIKCIYQYVQRKQYCNIFQHWFHCLIYDWNHVRTFYFLKILIVPLYLKKCFTVCRHDTSTCLRILIISPNQQHYVCYSKDASLCFDQFFGHIILKPQFVFLHHWTTILQIYRYLFTPDRSNWMGKDIFKFHIYFCTRICTNKCP